MSLDIVNCRKCGKLYQKRDGQRICSECEKDLEEKFQQVREYVRDHPGVSIMEVSTENEISVEQIKQWVRQERLLFSDSKTSGMGCVVCGEPIATGKYCESCKKNMAHGLENAYKKQVTLKEPIKKDGNKMRFLDKY